VAVPDSCLFCNLDRKLWRKKGQATAPIDFNWSAAMKIDWQIGHQEPCEALRAGLQCTIDLVKHANFKLK
jgi:hypothetical protein